MSQDWLHRTPPLWFHMYFTASSSQASLERIWSCCITWSNVCKFRGGIVTFPIPFGDVSRFTCRYKVQAGAWGSQSLPGYNCCYVTLWNLTIIKAPLFLYPKLNTPPPMANKLKNPRVASIHLVILFWEPCRLSLQPGSLLHVLWTNQSIICDHWLFGSTCVLICVNFL